jgi:Holliday junction resolvase RusA-like endonuclease
MSITLTIPGKPIAKNRPRFTMRGKHPHAYSDQETEAGKTFLQIKEHVNGRNLLTGPLSVSISFFMPRPKGHFGTGRNAGKLKPSAPKFHIVKPDKDNLEKFYYDVLNGLVWKDDAQVISGSAKKLYCKPGQEPFTDIFIKEIV